MGVETDDTRVYAAAFETEIPRIKDSLFWMGYMRIEALGALNEVPESAPFHVASYPENAGNWDLYNFHLQFTNIFDIGLDWFASYTHMHIDNQSEGSVIAVTLPDGSSLVVNEAGIYSESLNGSLGENRDGNCIYTGLRYRLPVRSMKFPSIGFEFSSSSKYWTGVVASGGGDLINKLDVNGEVYELYYIQPIIRKRMSVRVGGIRMDHDYENLFSIYGDQAESDKRVTWFYFLADVRF